MDMNKAFYLKKEDQQPQWWLVDAEGLILGRLATRVADVLRGRHKAEYTPHADAGDYVVIINAEKIALSGNKLHDKEYARYTGWIGGYKTTTAHEMLKKFPERVIEHAVKGMLPKNKLSDQVIKKLKVYAGSEHPHAAQNPKKVSSAIEAQ